MSWLRFWRRRRTAQQPLPAGSVVPGRATPAPVVVGPSSGPGPVEWLQPSAAEPVVAAVRPDDVPVPQPEPTAPRVGLVFGDGTHVVLDPDDPKAARFAALAEELNR